MVLEDLQQLAAEYSAVSDPWELLELVTKQFPGEVLLGTSGQLSGSAILEGASRHNISLRVYTLDTGRLFPETYAYFEKLEARYGIKIEKILPDALEVKTWLTAMASTYFSIPSPSKNIAAKSAK